MTQVQQGPERAPETDVCTWWTVSSGAEVLQKNKLEIQLQENFLVDPETTFLTWVRREFHPLPESHDSPMTTNPSKTRPGLKEITQS